jgi:hypothetical protein
VALAQFQGRITMPDGQSSTSGVRPLMVLQRQESGEWLVAAFQNTPIMERPRRPQ